MLLCPLQILNTFIKWQFKRKISLATFDNFDIVRVEQLHKKRLITKSRDVIWDLLSVQASIDNIITQEYICLQSTGE